MDYCEICKKSNYQFCSLCNTRTNQNEKANREVTNGNHNEFSF